MPDNVGETFYYGEIPWHKKGTRLEAPATATEAIKAGGLDWTVSLVPIQTEERKPREITRRVAVVRDDIESGDPRAVLGVVHPEFCPLQNRDAVKVFDALLTAGQSSQQSGNPPPQRLYHTGGYLGNGEVIWMLARLPKTIAIAGKDDVVESYMLLTNSHDGTFAISFRLTTVRVVCQNTLALAMRGDKSSHVFRSAHKIGPAKLAAEAKEFYQFSTKTAAEVGETFQKMHRKQFGPDQLESLVAKLLPLPRPPADGSVALSVRRQYDTRVQKITEARKGIVTVFAEGCRNGLEIPPAEETLWGALNAVTAFVDHKQEISGDRYAYMLFGSGATLKQKAYDLVLAQLPK
jgi:phage/plasmid-like protein (TIGR03299 family)